MMLNVVPQLINRYLSTYSPWQVILGTLVAETLPKFIYKLYKTDWAEVRKSWERRIYQKLPYVPLIGPRFQAAIDKELQPALYGLDRDIHLRRFPFKRISGSGIDGLPYNGYSENYLLEFVKNDVRSANLQKMSGGIYVDLSSKITQFFAQIREVAGFTNPLHSGAWPQLGQRRAEVISWCAQLYKGKPNEIKGTITPGGTYSIMAAMVVYRKWASKRADNAITAEWNIVVPSSVHPAFFKAAEDYCIKLKIVPVNPLTQRANPKAMEDAIDSNTIAMVGSLPSFPCGAMDPIDKLSEIAHRRKIGLHVDACLGGFIAPFVRDTNQLFGFDFEGVTSISMDTHKFGQAPKGSSVILFREHIGRHQPYVYLDAQMGMYVTPSQAGSESGAQILEPWAAMLRMGINGYMATAQAIMELKRHLLEQLRLDDRIKILGEADLMVIAFNTPHHNIYCVTAKMKEQGWYLNNLHHIPKENGEFENGAHFCFTANHLTDPMFVQSFLLDLWKSIQYVADHPKELQGDAPMYISMAKMPKVGASYLQEQLGIEYTMLEENVETTLLKPTSMH